MMNSANFAQKSSKKFLWSVTIFTAREQPDELLATIVAVMHASDQRSVIDVMVNGNPELALNISKLIAPEQFTAKSPTVRVWSTPLGGKAHAWNQYVHLVWPGTTMAFFVDGYARISQNALELLAQGMATAADAIAGTGLPTSGRTASKLRDVTLREGGFHGNFFAINESAMLELRRRHFRLPLGLYGFDTLLGGILGFGLDPAKNSWDAKKFIFVHPDVTWTIDEKKWWHYSAVKTQAKRILNNALRKLVIGATKSHLAKQKLPVEQVPRTIEDFVLGWATKNPDEMKKIVRKSPLSLLAMRKLREPKDWSAAEVAPELTFTSQRSA